MSTKEDAAKAILEELQSDKWWGERKDCTDREVYVTIMQRLDEILEKEVSQDGM